MATMNMVQLLLCDLCGAHVDPKDNETEVRLRKRAELHVTEIQRYGGTSEPPKDRFKICAKCGHEVPESEWTESYRLHWDRCARSMSSIRIAVVKYRDHPTPIADLVPDQDILTKEDYQAFLRERQEKNAEVVDFFCFTPTSRGHHPNYNAFHVLNDLEGLSDLIRWVLTSVYHHQIIHD